VNPYHVPGASDGAGPLCPHTNPAHEGFYVPVDHTLLAFEQFKTAIGDASSVRTAGRLVVALGGDGCGKSSLLNRCAAWLKPLLNKGEDGPCQLFSYVDTCDVSMSREARDSAVYQCLLDDLEARGMIPSPHGKKLNEYRADLKLGYRYLSTHVLKSHELKDAALVILLPRTELKEEVEHYASWTYSNIVFLAESREVEPVRAHWQKIRGASAGPAPIRLEVGQLTEEDGWTFVKARNGHRTDAVNYPFVSEETIRRVSKRPDLSIRELENLLFRLYQEILGQSTGPDSLGSGLTGELTYDTITDFYWRQGTM